MTPLQRKALGTIPLTYATVESFYDGSRSGTAEQCLKALCASHERLRMELEGAETLIEEDEHLKLSIAALNAKLARAAALTDTGSAEFRAAFPTLSVGGHYFPRDSVPGWRVVDAIREVLLGQT